MNNSSTTASSLIGNLLSPSAASARPASVKPARETVSFTETLSDVRQDAARSKPRSVARRNEVDDSRASSDIRHVSKRQTTHAEQQKSGVKETRAPGKDHGVQDKAARVPEKSPHTQEKAARVQAETTEVHEKADHPAGEQSTTTIATDKVKASLQVDLAGQINAPKDALSVTEEGVVIDSLSISPTGEEDPAKTSPDGGLVSLAGDELLDGQEASLTGDSALAAGQSAVTDAPAAALAGLASTIKPVVADPAATGDTAEESTIKAEIALAIDADKSAKTPKAPDISTSIDSDKLTRTSVSLDDGTLITSKQGDLSSASGAKDPFAKLLAGAELQLPIKLAEGEAKADTRATLTASQATPALEAIARAAESLPIAARGFVVQTGVGPSLGHPQWSQAVGDRVLWLAAQNITSAELRLDPPELGPMQVRVSVHQDQVQVNFTSAHAGVREALDQGAARLREMFNEQGLNLNVSVSDQSAHRREGDEGSSGRRQQGEPGVADESVVAETAVTNLRLIDSYA
jgi:flagellar hook-length control protein FliK